MANTHTNNIIAKTSSGTQAYRASLLHFTNDPAFHQQAYTWHEDGLLIIQEGKVLAVGDYAALKNILADKINDLINHDFNQLIQILYRIDVSEKKLKITLQENKNEDALKFINQSLIFFTHRHYQTFHFG